MSVWLAEHTTAKGSLRAAHWRIEIEKVQSTKASKRPDDVTHMPPHASSSMAGTMPRDDARTYNKPKTIASDHPIEAHSHNHLQGSQPSSGNGAEGELDFDPWTLQPTVFVFHLRTLFRH